MTYFIGIDPGQKGGIAILGDGSSGPIEVAYPMPLAGREIDWGLFASTVRLAPAIAVVEKVHSMPKQGVASTFKFGVNVGGIYAVLASLAIPYHLVHPTKWKKAILEGTQKGKADAIAYVVRAYPELSLYPTERSRTRSDGMADAVCLAEYCRRVYG